MPTMNSLQDVIVAIKSDGSAEDSKLLHVANMIVGYCNQPAHEITLRELRQNMRYFPLYLSFRRVPLGEVDLIVELADLLLARASMAQYQVSNHIPHGTYALGDDAPAAESASMSVAL